MAVITNTQAASAIANIIARLLIRSLRANTVLPQFVGRDYDADDIREHGDRITINTLGALSVNNKVQGSPVTLQNPSTSGTPIVLQQPEVSFAIDNVTKIQARPDLMAGYANKAGIALAEYINSTIASTAWPLAGGLLPLQAPLTANSFYDAKRLLNVAKMPSMDRFAVLGTDADREANDITEFTNWENQGEAAWLATQAGILGSLGGFRTYMSQGITETGGEVKNLFFSKEAIQLVTRPLDTSMNGNGVATVLMDDNGEGGTGLAFRTSLWYDADVQSWNMTVDALFGVNVVEPDGVVVVPTADVP